MEENRDQRRRRCGCPRRRHRGHGHGHHHHHSGVAAPTTASAHHAKTGKHGKSKDPLRNAVHAQWVTRDAKTKTFLTHDEIRGTVTAVTPTSVSVKAADAITETYAITPATNIHNTGTKGSTAPISDVKTGDTVTVLGTGTTTLTAAHIADTGAKKVK